MSTDKIVSELQSTNPSAIIELFTLTLDNTLHGATTTYRFHAGTSLKDNGDIIWAGNTYTKFPVEAEGFKYGKNIYYCITHERCREPRVMVHWRSTSRYFCWSLGTHSFDVAPSC